MGPCRSPYLRQRNFSEALALEPVIFWTSTNGLSDYQRTLTRLLAWSGVLGPATTPAQAAPLVQSMSTLLYFTYP